MTQKEKAERYDEILARAKVEYAKFEGMLPGDVLEDVISELKESDDDKIRKALLNEFTALQSKGYKFAGLEAEELIAWLEKQGEQKSVDKVEPKFKVGDWIVTDYGKVNQVVKVDEDGDGYTLDDDTYFSGSWINMYHLWTIKDAKPGDVLVDRFSKVNTIILYKGINLNRSILAYCGLNGYDLSIKTDGLGYGNLDNTNYSLATKGQCKFLFAKLKEAGYKWDTDKKELKKMEQLKLINNYKVWKVQ